MLSLIVDFKKVYLPSVLEKDAIKLIGHNFTFHVVSNNKYHIENGECLDGSL